MASLAKKTHRVFAGAHRRMRKEKKQNRYRIGARTLLLLCIVASAMLFACAPKANDLPAPITEPEIIAEKPIIIVAMGDSLTAGYGLSESDAYPAQLERRLQERGYNVRVINAGISGETSSAARTRTEWVLSLEPDIMILETGANDGLRGIDPSFTKENIDAIVTMTKKQEVVVLLAGMQIVQNMGREYTEAFRDMYPAIAKEQEVLLMPFFLEGVAGDQSLNLDDGIHPTADGYARIVENILPYVEEAILEMERNAGS